MKTAIALCALAAAIGGSSPALANNTISVHTRKIHHHIARCGDKVLCHKIDNLTASVDRDFQAVSNTVTAGQAADAEYHAKSLAIQTDTNTLVKSIEGYEAQGAQVQHAIYMSFDNKPLAADEDPAATATKVCTDAGFKAGKPVDISEKHYVFRNSEHLLKSVVCTY